MKWRAGVFYRTPQSQSTIATAAPSANETQRKQTIGKTTIGSVESKAAAQGKQAVAALTHAYRTPVIGAASLCVSATVRSATAMSARDSRTQVRFRPTTRAPAGSGSTVTSNGAPPPLQHLHTIQPGWGVRCCRDGYGGQLRQG